MELIPKKLKWSYREFISETPELDDFLSRFIFDLVLGISAGGVAAITLRQGSFAAAVAVVLVGFVVLPTLYFGVAWIRFSSKKRPKYRGPAM